MTAEDTPRTWTLAMCPSGEDGVAFHVAATQGPEIGWNADVPVIELEPVLDLLTRAHGPMRATRHWTGAGPHPVLGPLAGEIAALLRAHGRLKGVGDE